MYSVYIVLCSDNTYYTGITNNLIRRIKQHNWLLRWWAKYTSYRRPVKLVYTKNYETRSQASKREYEIKKMTRKEKIKLIS